MFWVKFRDVVVRNHHDFEQRDPNEIVKMRRQLINNEHEQHVHVRQEALREIRW